MYRRFGKRALDVILSVFALLILWPVLAVLAVLVRCKLGSPMLFRQERPGKDEKIFILVKFRTMTDEKDSDGNLLPDAQRLTPLGRFLRSTSLDELPELFNILRGDMSFVGPRPLLVRDMVFMTENQRRRHTVPQGLTGLAQINGRNGITWEEKLQLDLEYVDNLSFGEDFRIFFQTIGKVLRRSDINFEGMATAEDLGDYLLRTGRVDSHLYESKLKDCKENVRI